MKRIYRVAICCAALTGAASADVAVKKTPDRVVEFKQVGEGKKPLKLHIFKPKGEKKAGRPCVVFFFGGGWTGGSARQFYQQARELSDKGVVAISADYRTKKSHGTTPLECVKDGKSAIRWVRQHAAELGIDKDKVVAAGGSAGGHVACCTGVVKGGDEAGEDLKISSVPNAMVLFNPVIDTTKKGYGSSKMIGLGTTLSPSHLVEAKLPPTLILHGKADKVVPHENVERFTQLMLDAGNTCKLVSYQDVGHGFFNGKWFRGSSDGQGYKATMLETTQFLKKLNLLAK